MTDGLSAGDILALTREDNDMNQMWNNPFIYLVWLAVLGGGGLFGNRTTELQNAVTRSDLFEGFNNQDVNGQLRGITNGICDGFYAINSGMKDGFYANNVAAKPIATLMQFVLRALRIPALLPMQSTLKRKPLAH